MLRPTVVLRRNALRKGVFGGHKGWLAVGALLWGRGWLKRTFGRNEEVLLTETLRKGQWLRLEAVGPPTRKERRAARRVN